MGVFVLTQKEGNRSTPVGVCSNQGDANAWAAKASGNDWFSFEVDQLEHLNLPNGPEYRPAPAKVFAVPMPATPKTDESDPVGSLKSLSGYLRQLTTSMEAMQHALQG